MLLTRSSVYPMSGGFNTSPEMCVVMNFRSSYCNGGGRCSRFLAVWVINVIYLQFEHPCGGHRGGPCVSLCLWSVSCRRGRPGSPWQWQGSSVITCSTV